MHFITYDKKQEIKTAFTSNVLHNVMQNPKPSPSAIASKILHHPSQTLPSPCTIEGYWNWVGPGFSNRIGYSR